MAKKFNCQSNNLEIDLECLETEIDEAVNCSTAACILISWICIGFAIFLLSCTLLLAFVAFLICREQKYQPKLYSRNQDSKSRLLSCTIARFFLNDFHAQISCHDFRCFIDFSLENYILEIFENINFLHQQKSLFSAKSVGFKS